MENTVKNDWVVKDRIYELRRKKPLTFALKTRHSQRSPLVWFDPELGYERELRYATNQKSVFVDEQKGTSTLGHVVFNNGILYVPKEKRNLQELLSLYHPAKGITYKEQDAEKEASDELEFYVDEAEALATALELEIDHCSAILRVEIGSKVSKMSSKEIRRDIILMAKQNPRLFLDLVEDDNVQLRDFGIVACELGIIKISQDQKSFAWASNGRKLMSVPFDENPYSALADWFKTDEGVEVYKSIEKKLK